jgi:cysteine desulfuration protein SufE
MTNLPQPLQDIVNDFSLCVGQEKLEYLLEFASSLAPLPEWLHAQRAGMQEVHECMTPVFVFADRQDGRLRYHFDVPPEAPTVRGFAAILQQGLNGATPAQVQAIPSDFYLEMGLQAVLSGQRLNGIGAILRHMQRIAADG